MFNQADMERVFRGRVESKLALLVSPIRGVSVSIKVAPAVTETFVSTADLEAHVDAHVEGDQLDVLNDRFLEARRFRSQHVNSIAKLPQGVDAGLIG